MALMEYLIIYDEGKKYKKKGRMRDVVDDGQNQRVAKCLSSAPLGLFI